jgi:ADP-ribosylglycohydrolase
LVNNQRIELDYGEYHRQVHGCWVGKAVGGTLGGPWEGKKPPQELSFYDPVPEGVLPNDDLDLQVAWLARVRQEGLPIDRRLLAGAWGDHIVNWPDEYGICQRNLAMRLWPALSGGYDNQSPNGMGAAIRTELWACLAPGDPDLAAHLAVEDACCDHHGDGIDAAVFLAAVQSAAFVEGDRDKLIDLGLGKIDPAGRVARGIRLVLERFGQVGDREAMLAEIIERFGTENFTDVAVNLPIIVLAWLIGGGDFDTAILAAANCGQDTDCTCATLGATLGLIDPDCIGPRWLAPIGEDLVLSVFMAALAPPATLDELTDQVADIAPQVLSYYGSSVALTDAPPAGRPLRRRLAPGLARRVSLRRPADRRTALLASDPLAVELRYPDAVRLAPGQAGRFRLEVTNCLDRAVCLEAGLLAPDGWTAEPARAVRDRTLAPGERLAAPFAARPGDPLWRPYSSRLVVELRLDGIPLRYEAGLLMTIPALRWSLGGQWPTDLPQAPPSAECIEARGHFLDLPDNAPEGLGFAFDVKLTHPDRLNLVAMCGRAVRLWLDEALIVDHRGARPVPPAYRIAEAAGSLEVRRGRYRLTVAVAGGDGEAGQLYWALGSGRRRAKPGRWYTQAEFTRPR